MGLHVLLTQGLLPSALAVARSLAEAGHRVTLGDHDGSVIARFSRHVAGFVRLPPPAPDPGRFFDAVMAAARRVGADVVLPLFEEGLLLSACWDRQSAFAARTPPFDLAIALADKGTGVAIAGRAGLAIADTLPATATADEIERDLGVPLVVKPRLASSGVGVTVVRDRDALGRVLDALPRRDDHVAQRWAGERQLVFQGVFDQGRCIGAHAYRVLCRHPPAHGFGILLESALDQAILTGGIRLGEHVGYHGAMGIDFLAGNDGLARVVEVNPRMVLGVVNAVDSGVPIPARTAELGWKQHATVTAAAPGYEAGVRTLHWPSQGVTAVTGEGLGAQLAGWARKRLDDPGALAAFFAQVVLHRIRGGFDTAALDERGLTSDLARRLLAERERAGA